MLWWVDFAWFQVPMGLFVHSPISRVRGEDTKKPMSQEKVTLANQA